MYAREARRRGRPEIYHEPVLTRRHTMRSTRGAGHRSGHSPTCQPVPTPTHIFLESIATFACNPDVNYHNVEAHSLGLELRLCPAVQHPAHGEYRLGVTCR